MMDDNSTMTTLGNIASETTTTTTSGLLTASQALSSVSSNTSTANDSSASPMDFLLEYGIAFEGDPTKRRLNEALTAMSVLILIEVMLGLGCAVDLELLRTHIKKPVGILVAAFTQFGLMPLIAFGLANAVNLGPVPGLATLVTSSVPGGILSNVLACLIRGDMSLSMLMTTTSTILALGFIPLNLFIYGSHWLPSDTEIGSLVPYSSIAMSFALMILPTVCGICVKWKWPDAALKVITACKILLLLTITGLIVLSAELYGTELFRNMPSELWLVAFILPALGFALGFMLSSLGGLRDSARRTVAIETGCQNSNMGAAILKVAFPAQMIGSYFLYPLVYGAIQFIEGIIIVIICLIYLKIQESKNETNKDDNSEKKEGTTEEDGGNNQSSEGVGSFRLWWKSMELRWLSRRGGDDKKIILHEEFSISEKENHVVTNLAHEIAEEAISTTGIEPKHNAKET